MASFLNSIHKICCIATTIIVVLFFTVTLNAQVLISKDSLSIMNIEKVNRDSILLDMKKEQKEKYILFQENNLDQKELNNTIDREILKIESFLDKSDTQYETYPFSLQQIISQEIIIEDEKEQTSSDEMNSNKIIYDVEPSPNKNEEETKNKESITSANKKQRIYKGKTQYDSRIELNQLKIDNDADLFIATASKSVGIIVERNILVKIAPGIYRLNTTKNLEDILSVCETVAFKKQPVVGVGTGFIIEGNIFITARHVFQKNPNQYAIVFGYQIANKQNAVYNTFSDEDVYFIEKISRTNKKLDICTFETNKPFKGVQLQVGNKNNIKKDQEVYMLGYPLGLPQKLTINASILDNKHPQYFYTSLDSFAGNSGSPIFNKYTNTVIGVMVSGGIDFKYNGSCYSEKSCKPPFCIGEKAIKINAFFEAK